LIRHQRDGLVIHREAIRSQMMKSGTARHRPRRLAVGLVLALIAGCGGDVEGPPTVPVSGTLTVDGKPVSQGTVHFHPANGRPATGMVKDGKFTLTTYTEGDGAIPGKNQVSVEVVEEVPTKDGDTTVKSLILPRYMNPATSKIQLDLRASGYKNLQIDIKGESASIKED
jgi:hypothetical protein